MKKKTVNSWSDLRGEIESILDTEHNVLYINNQYGLVGSFVAYSFFDKEGQQRFALRQGSEHRKIHDRLVDAGANTWWTITDNVDFVSWNNREEIPHRKLTPKLLELAKKVDKLLDKTKVGCGATHIEMGVELELEKVNVERVQEHLNDYVGERKLIHDIGTDCSVYRGSEIRFNHPMMSKWKTKEVRRILREAKRIGCGTGQGTAGMHVHVSHPRILVAINTFKDNLSLMQKILYPINCRPKMKKKEDGTEDGSVSYGTGTNIYHDQSGTFGTLEIRAWNATLDTRMFMARVRFSRFLVDYLAHDTKPTLAKIFHAMKPQTKRDYLYMLDSKENPHEWGNDTQIRQLLAA